MKMDRWMTLSIAIEIKWDIKIKGESCLVMGHQRPLQTIYFSYVEITCMSAKVHKEGILRPIKLA